MYFVRYAEKIYRYTGTERWNVNELPEFTSYYDFDDERKWSVAGLKKEARRVAFGAEDWDEDALTAIDAELARRNHSEEPLCIKNWNGLLNALADDDEEEDDDEDRRPIIYPEDITLPTRRLIRDVAKMEHEEMAFRKKNAAKQPGDLNEKTIKEFMKLDEKGWKAREALMNSDLAQMILECYDPIEDLKTMAAQMFFLYSQERMRAEVEGREPDEEFFYAGSNLYAHAVVSQIADANADEEDDEADDDDYVFPQDMDMNELAKYAEAFSERVKSGDLDDEFLEGMDQVMEYTMKEKGFDINTLSGAKAAQKFLENARVEDAFITEGPIDNAVDWHMGEARLDAMLKCVKARIQKMINKN